ncbi:hypothetical protein BO71DRAFT_489089 [Aspergillus ellipticus CBS 707.79]|uniref:Uncharacterized protein n=1 Tax=Aspergillus ellipticus CBS 707.79 TaxID=1448320 RepID=A0A319CRV1_9EURO|nr:hypothetical protein BO71DRAFT_489089 [Aspergillus ellipticus CBS 707.79]
MDIIVEDNFPLPRINYHNLYSSDKGLLRVVYGRERLVMTHAGMIRLPSARWYVHLNYARELDANEYLMLSLNIFWVSAPFKKIEEILMMNCRPPYLPGARNLAKGLAPRH